MNIILDDLVISHEAISVQTDSKLGKRLTDMFNECIKIRESKYQKDMSTNDLTKLITKVSNYISKTLPKIVDEETGIRVKNVICNNYRPTGYVAVDYFTDIDITAVNEIERAIVGLDNATYKNISKGLSSRIDHIVNIASTFDTKTSRFKNVKYKWPITLHIDTSLFIFLDAFYPSDKPFEPEQATAVILHELGHIAIIAERAKSLVYVAKTVDDNIKKISKQTLSIEDTSNLLKSVRNMTDVVIEKGISESDRDTATKIKPIINTAIDLISYIDNTHTEHKFSNSILSKIDEPSYISGYIKKVIVNICELIIVLPLKILMTPLALLYSLTPELNGMSSRKLSDIKYTAHNDYLLERAADEFVVRHGYAAHISTSLEKLIEIDSRYNGSNTLIRDSKFIQILTSITSFIENFGMPNYPYEHDDQRIRRIVQATMGIFKDTSIPATFRDQQLSGLKKSLAVLDKMGTDIYNRRTFDALKRISEALLSPDEWVRIFTSGRLTQEYERQFNQMEDLINNAMYGHYAQLKKLIDSK